jgi:hypothetical protein
LSDPIKKPETHENTNFDRIFDFSGFWLVRKIDRTFSDSSMGAGKSGGGALPLLA